MTLPSFPEAYVCPCGTPYSVALMGAPQLRCEACRESHVKALRLQSGRRKNARISARMRGEPEPVWAAKRPQGNFPKRMRRDARQRFLGVET